MNRKVLLLLFMLFCNCILFAQLQIKGEKFKKFINIEFSNNSESKVYVDNISFRNFNDKCKTISYLNKRSYYIDKDTLKFNFNYLPKCFKPYNGRVKIKKIEIEADDIYNQFFRIPKRRIRNIHFVEIYYYQNNKKNKLLVPLNR